jgi:hypothetical protein
MKTFMRTLLKPLSLALFIAATLPTQSAYIRTSSPSDTISAIGPSSHFCKAIGGKNNDGGYSLIQTSDGGYAIAGDTKSFGAGNWDVYVVKLDATGNLQWTRTIGGENEDLGHSLIQTSDGGYVIAGHTKSFGAGDWDVYVVKLDATGNLQWTRTIGGENEDLSLSLIQTSDGGYALAGATRSFSAGEDDVYVVKLDANGNLQWTKTIGGPNRDWSSSLIQTSDGGYAIAGYTKSFGVGGADVYVVKLDANGNLQWTKTIGEPADEVGFSLIQTSDGGYAIAGYTSSFGAGSWDVYVVKLDANGNLQWTKTIGGKGWEAGHSLIRTSDGGYAIAGTTTSFGAGGWDVYVVKLDASGNLQWTKTIGGPKEDWGASLIQTSDGGYAIAGHTRSFGVGDWDVYVVKLNANGNLQWTKTIGGPKDDWGASLIQTSDGGYAIAGTTTSSGAEEWDVYIVKLNANGKPQWTKTIGAKNRYSNKPSLIQTSDGGYAIAGDTKSFGAGEEDVYFIKLDKNGNACCAISQTSRVGSGGRLRSATPSIGSGGTLTSPTPSTSSGGTLTSQCP